MSSHLKGQGQVGTTTFIANDFPGGSLIRLLGDRLPTKASPVRRLTEVAFDTSECDLARLGVTVCQCSTEAGERWLVRQVEFADGQFNTIREFAFPSENGLIPRSVLDFLTAYRRMQPIASIGSVDVDLQRVDVFDKRRSLQGIAELAAIKTHGAAFAPTQRYQMTVQHRIDQKGGEKLFRTLRHSAMTDGFHVASYRPWSLHLEAPYRAMTAAHAKNDIATLAFSRSLSTLLATDLDIRLDATPESVHQYRVAIRRLRSALRSYASLRDLLSAIDVKGELEWLGAQVGNVRDSDVLRLRLRSISHDIGAEDAQGLPALMEILDRSCDEHRVSLLEVLNSTRYVWLVDALCKIVEDSTDSHYAGAPTSKSGAEDARTIVRSQWNKLSKAAGKIDSNAQNEQFHRCRILAKRCRYASESAESVYGREARQFARSLARFQDFLGDLHDSVVAEQWVKVTSINGNDISGVADAIIAQLHDEQLHLRGQWKQQWHRASAPGLRRWLS